MPSPFPGMNPYLEHPEIWPGFHHWLIIEIARVLSPQLRPKYLVSVEVRLYETTAENSLLVGLPDVSVQRLMSNSNSTISNIAVAEPAPQPVTVTLPMRETIRQGYLQIREVSTKEVITAIELLSPVNKRPGKGREIYEKKRQNILESSTNFVEIDLLRKWQPMPLFSNEIQTHYRILVSKVYRRPRADLYAFNLPNIIPSFPLPLRSEDCEPIIDLQALLNDIYDHACYDLKLDYRGEPIPPLSETDTTWAKTLFPERESG